MDGVESYMPNIVLWSLQGELEQWYDVLEIRRIRAEDVRGHGIDCSHYLAEEPYTALHDSLPQEKIK
jgi:hypothetical protein